MKFCFWYNFQKGGRAVVMTQQLGVYSALAENPS